MPDTAIPSCYNYTNEIVVAKLLLDRAEIAAVLNPTVETHARLKLALSKYKLVLENPEGLTGNGAHTD